MHADFYKRNEVSHSLIQLRLTTRNTIKVMECFSNPGLRGEINSKPNSNLTNNQKTNANSSDTIKKSSVYQTSRSFSIFEMKKTQNKNTVMKQQMIFGTNAEYSCSKRVWGNEGPPKFVFDSMKTAACIWKNTANKMRSKRISERAPYFDSENLTFLDYLFLCEWSSQQWGPL